MTNYPNYPGGRRREKLLIIEIMTNCNIIQEDGTEIKGGWRHDRGAKGDCANGCCESETQILSSPSIISVSL